MKTSYSFALSILLSAAAGCVNSPPEVSQPPASHDSMGLPEASHEAEPNLQPSVPAALPAAASQRPLLTLAEAAAAAAVAYKTPAGDPATTLGVPPGATGMGSPRTHTEPSQAKVGLSLGASATVTANQLLTIEVSGRSFDKTTEGGGLDLSFDPAVVQVVDVVVDKTTWEFFSQRGNVDADSGKITGIVFASFAGHRGSFPIAKVTLRALANGMPRLRLAESQGNPFASGGQRLAVSFD